MTRPLLLLLAALVLAACGGPDRPVRPDAAGAWCATNGDTVTVDLDQTQPVGNASSWSALHGQLTFDRGVGQAVAGNIDRQGRVVLNSSDEGLSWHLEGALVEDRGADAQLRLRMVDGEGLPSGPIVFHRCQEGEAS